MKSVRLVQIFRPVKETNRTHSRGYVEDLSTQRGRKRCAKMAVLNLSVLPICAVSQMRGSRPMDMADMPSRGTAPARGMGFILTHLISPCKLHQRFS